MMEANELADPQMPEEELPTLPQGNLAVALVFAAIAALISAIAWAAVAMTKAS